MWRRRTRRGGARNRVARAACTLAAALGVSCAARPFRGDTGIRPFGFDLWDVHCPSGLRVIVERAPGSPVAGVTTIVGAGGHQDPPGREGLAHLVEHLAFRRHGPDQATVEERLALLGTTSNAHTAFDETTYYAFTAAGNLRALLSLEGERLGDPLLGVDETTFAVEREVVRSELRQRQENDATGFGFNGVERAVFPAAHPYSRPIIGTHQSLSAITLDDARRFTAAHYRPSEMTMVVVGDIDLSHADELVRQLLPPALYGDEAHRRPVAKPGTRLPPAAAPPSPPPASAAVARLPAAVRTPELWIAWASPGGYGADRFVGQMWASLVENNFWAGRFDDPDIADVDFYVWPQPLATLFVCRVSLTEGSHPESSLREVVAALPWVGGDEIWLEERFQRLKLRALRELAFSAERIQPRSEERAGFAHFTGSLSYYGETMTAVQSITADQARDFAVGYLAPERARAVLLEPLPDLASPREGAPASHDVASRVKHPPLPAPTVAHLAAVKHLRNLRAVTLPNGLQTVIVPRPGAPVITASLGLHGGRASGAPGVAAAAQYALRLNFEESPGDFGIGIGVHFDTDMSMATVSAGAANLPRALDMLLFALRSYDVEWPSDKFRATMLPYLQRHESGPVGRLDRRYREALFHGHPSGRTPTPDEIAATGKPEVARWIERSLNPHNALLVIVGDISEAEAEAAARDAFGGWSAGGQAVPAPPPFAAPAAAPASGPTPAAFESPAGFVVVHRPGATQASLRLGCVLPPVDARLDAVGDVAAEVADAHLTDALRRRIGSTYGVQVTASAFRGGGATLELATAINNGQLAPALSVLRRFWMRAARGRVVTPRELEVARGILASGRLLVYERSSALAGALMAAWNLGWPLDSPDRYAEYLGSVTLDEVNATLAGCARSMVVALLGDEKTIRAALVSSAASAAPAPPEAPPPGPPPPPAPEGDEAGGP